MKSNSTGSPREVGHEHERALEDPDEQRRILDVVARDILAEITNALLQLRFVDDNAADVGVVHPRALAFGGLASAAIHRKRRVRAVTFTLSSIR